MEHGVASYGSCPFTSTCSQDPLLSVLWRGLCLLEVKSPFPSRPGHDPREPAQPAPSAPSPGPLPKASCSWCTRGDLPFQEKCREPTLSPVVFDGHKTLWSLGLNLFHGLTLNSGPNSPSVRQWVLPPSLLREGFRRGAACWGSHDGWVAELRFGQKSPEA